MRLQQLPTTTRKHPDAHDDMIGLISTGITGANQWMVQNVRDTLFPLQFLRNNSSDFYCISAQSPHTRKQGVNADSLHVHYLLDAAYIAGQTIVFDVFYTWVIPNTTFPALSGWQQEGNIVIVLNATSNLPQWHTGIVALVREIAPPFPEGYGTGFIARIVRGNGTYPGNIGIWWGDVHIVKDRAGSVFEAWDTE